MAGVPLNRATDHSDGVSAAYGIAFVSIHLGGLAVIGIGSHSLAAVLVSLNLPAFTMHTVCDIGDEL